MLVLIADTWCLILTGIQILAEQLVELAKNSTLSGLYFGALSGWRKTAGSGEKVAPLTKL